MLKKTSSAHDIVSNRLGACIQQARRIYCANAVTVKAFRFWHENPLDLYIMNCAIMIDARLVAARDSQYLPWDAHCSEGGCINCVGTAAGLASRVAAAFMR